MKRAIATALLLVGLGVGPSWAEPDLRIQYPNGIPRVEIVGDFRNSRYTVWRAGGPEGQFTNLTSTEALCTADCYVDDFTAVGGHTYWYRFDLALPEGGRVSFGPYQATISPYLARSLSASVSPNPGRGPATVVLFAAGFPGGSVHTDAAVFDLQGRRLATIHRGPLATGATRFRWNGRTDDGRELSSGLYLLRVVTADGRHLVARVARMR